MAKMKILIAIDEPNWAKILVHTAYNFIDRKNSEITLLNVVENNTTEENYFYSKPEKFIEHEAEKENFVLLENFLENSEVDYKGFIYKEGDPADVITKLTNHENYDLLIVGSHNKNPIERLLLGSVAYKVTRSAKSSILIINSKYHIETSKLKPFSALIGVDISENSFFVAENTGKFIDKDRANITLLNVTTSPSLIIPPDAYIYIDMEKIINETNQVAENLLQQIAQELEKNGIKVVKKYHLEGEAASTLMDEAETNNYNLIIIGSHGGGKLSRWFLGSVSTKVYEHAKQPVLIIKER